MTKENSVYSLFIRCLLGITRRLSNEESSLVSESEPLLLPKNDLAHPGDIICTFTSTHEPLHTDRSPTNLESSLTNQNTSTTDVKYESSKN